MGYHPGLEDDAIYLAAIKAQLHPSLYPHGAEFFRLQTEATIIGPWIASFVRITSIPLAWAELLWQFVSLFVILWACHGMRAIAFRRPGRNGRAWPWSPPCSLCRPPELRSLWPISTCIPATWPPPASCSRSSAFSPAAAGSRRSFWRWRFSFIPSWPRWESLSASSLSSAAVPPTALPPAERSPQRLLPCPLDGFLRARRPPGARLWRRAGTISSINGAGMSGWAASPRSCSSGFWPLGPADRAGRSLPVLRVRSLPTGCSIRRWR